MTMLLQVEYERNPRQKHGSIEQMKQPNTAEQEEETIDAGIGTDIPTSFVTKRPLVRDA